jgi:RHS repeat-associated protein
MNTSYNLCTLIVVKVKPGTKARGALLRLIEVARLTVVLLVCCEASVTVTGTTNVTFNSTAYIDGTFRAVLNNAVSELTYHQANCYGKASGPTTNVELIVNQVYTLDFSKDVEGCFAEGGVELSTSAGCYDLYVNGVYSGGTYTYSSDEPTTLEIELRSPNQATVNFSVNPLPPDSQSTSWASLSVPDGLPGPVTWTIQSTDDLGCSIVSTNGLITAGTNYGTIIVRATGTNGCYLEGPLDLDGCHSCAGGNCTQMGTVTSSLRNGLFVQINLGPLPRERNAGSMEIVGGEASYDLFKPAALDYSFWRSDVQVIEDGSDVRQIKTPFALADVNAVSTNKYTVDFYLAENVGIFTNGAYVVSGSPFSTVTVENPDTSGASSNQVRITESLNGTDTVYNYANTNGGWELESGNGFKTETEVIGVTNDVRTVTYKILSSSAQPLFVQTKNYESYAWGEGLIEEITGTGSNALTNSYSYYSDGTLAQAVRSDGSWESYIYDSLKRPTYIFSSWLNQAPTTNGALCRVIANDFSSSVVSGSGDEASLRTGTPRRSVESILGYEVSRHYNVSKLGEEQRIQAQTAGAAWDAADNMVTISGYYTNGLFLGKPTSILNPDGTKTIFNYAQNGSYTTNEVLSGIPDWFSETDTLYFGTDTTEVLDSSWRLVSHTVNAVYNSGANSCTTEQENYSAFDDFGRAQMTAYLDGSYSLVNYGCCGQQIVTNREGTVITYGYDALKRLITTKIGGITTSNILDAAGNLLATVRYGEDDSAVTTSGAAYDDAGRMITSYDALDNSTTYTNYFDSGGYRVDLVISPNGATRTNRYFRDGSLYETMGSAVAPVTYSYGIEYAGTNATGINITNLYRKEEKGSANEWVKTYSDMLGRAHKTVYASQSSPYPFTQNFYQADPDANGFNQGKLIRQIGLDGIIRLYNYDNYGQQSVQVEASIIDMDQDGSIGAASTDRIIETQVDYHNQYGPYVLRAQSYVYPTDNNSTRLLTSTVETSVDGHQTWEITFGRTNHNSILFAGGGARYETNMAPDGSYAISQFQDGRVLSAIQYDNGGEQVGGSAFCYDAHGRQSAVTNAATGTVSKYLYNDADQVVSNIVTATGLSDEITVYNYDTMGRVWRTLLPDGTSVTNEFYDTGLLKATYGSRTYPVQYEYDSQGRMTNMTTWQIFSSGTGAASTSWQYDGYRGFMTDKTYDDGSGPSYTYTDSGMIKTRTWERGLTTTYGYNEADEVDSIDYSDSTADITFTYDRQDRYKTIVQGSATTTLFYTDDGHLYATTTQGGVLNELDLARTFDILGRSESVYLPGVFTNQFGYEGASRLLSVTNGLHTATYSYLTKSSLVTNILFRQNGTNRLVMAKQFDGLNRLTNIVSTPSGTGQTVVAYGYQYNQANQRTRGTCQDSSYWVYQYDELGQVISGAKYWSDGTPVAGQQFAFEFDDIGNRKVARSGGNQWGTQLRGSAYNVNSLNQYTSRTVPEWVDVLGAANSNATVTVNFEPTYRKGEYFRKELRAANNLGPVYLSVTNFGVYSTNVDITNSFEGYLFVPQNPEVFSYDADGNLTNDGRWIMTWDAENRLTSLTSRDDAPAGSARAIQFEYDWQGRRIHQVVSNWTGSAWAKSSETKYLYNGWNLMAEFDGDDTLLRSYTWGSDLSGTLQGAGGVGGLLALRVHTGSEAGTYFYGYDGNGNVSALINAADGKVVAEYEYGPFGQLIRANGTLAKINPFRFSTKYADDETDLLYYGFRYYNPLTGRWPNRDPMGEVGGLNAYCFLKNDTRNKIDLLGLTEIRSDDPSGPWPPDPDSPRSKGCYEIARKDGRRFIFFDQWPGNQWELTAFDFKHDGTYDGITIIKGWKAEWEAKVHVYCCCKGKFEVRKGTRRFPKNMGIGITDNHQIC